MRKSRVLRQMGYTFNNVGSDVLALSKYYQEKIDAVSGRDIAEI